MSTSPPYRQPTLRTSSSSLLRGPLSIGIRSSNKSLQELSTQESVISLNVTSTKQTKLIEVYQFLLNERLLGFLSGSSGWETQGADALFELSSSTNTLVPCVISLLDSHFDEIYMKGKSSVPENANDPPKFEKPAHLINKPQVMSSFLEGNTLVTRLIDIFFQRIGSAYIMVVLGPACTKILDSNEWFEVESSPKQEKKSSDSGIDNLLSCLRSIVQSMTSSDSIFQMPEEMKCILNILFEFGCVLEPSNKYIFVSNCLTRFFMSIFTKPENFFKGREFTERVRKNFAMVSKVIQKVAEGAEFVDIDPMKVCNNFVKVNKDRMEQYFKDVSCHPASNPIDTSAMVLTPKSVDHLHEFFINAAVLVSALIQKESSLHKFQGLIATMRKLKNFEEFTNYKPPKAKYKTKIKMTVSIETEEGDTYDRVIEAPLSSLEQFITNSTTSVEKILQEHQQTVLIEGAVFGKPLEVLTKKGKPQPPTSRTYIPSGYIPSLSFLYDMIDYILLKGLSNRKIFDGSTKTNEVVNELRAMIDQGKIINYSKYSEVDVALVLKLFLKKLPDPLFPSSTLSLMDLPPDVRREKLKSEISRLPSINRHLVQLLSWLFWQFHLSDSSTELALDSITTIFGHTFACSEPFPDASPRGSMDTSSSRESKGLLKSLILEYESIFREHIAADMVYYGSKPMLRKRFVAHEESIVALEPNFDAKLCFSCSTGKESPLKVWSTEDHSMVKSIAKNTAILCMLQVSGSLWCASEKGISILSTMTLMTVEMLHTMHGASVLASYGNVVWSNSLQNNSIFVFDIQSFGARWFIVNPPAKDTAPPSVMVTVDKYIWVGCNTCIFVWNVETNEIKKQIKNAHTKKVRGFCGVGDTVWSCADDSTVKIWSKQNFQLLKEVEAHNGRVKKILKLPHSPIVWSCSSDMTVRLWNSQTGDILEELQHFSDAVSDMVFTYNYTKKIWTAWVACYDRTITIYEFTEESMTKAQPVWTLQMIRKFSTLLE